MKEHKWRDGNHMIFESGHKTFDQQVDCISTGNVIGNVQYSNHIRPYIETECNGFTNSPGHLRDYDLKYFDNLPRRIRKEIEGFTQEKSGWLYEFHHWDGHHKIIHGYVFTDYEHNLVKQWVTGPTYRSREVIDEAVKYVSN